MSNKYSRLDPDHWGPSSQLLKSMQLNAKNQANTLQSSAQHRSNIANAGALRAPQHQTLTGTIIQADRQIDG